MRFIAVSILWLVGKLNRCRHIYVVKERHWTRQDDFGELSYGVAKIVCARCLHTRMISIVKDGSERVHYVD